VSLMVRISSAAGEELIESEEAALVVVLLVVLVGDSSSIGLVESFTSSMCYYEEREISKME